MNIRKVRFVQILKQIFPSSGNEIQIDFIFDISKM